MTTATPDADVPERPPPTDAIVPLRRGSSRLARRRRDFPPIGCAGPRRPAPPEVPAIAKIWGACVVTVALLWTLVFAYIIPLVLLSTIGVLMMSGLLAEALRAVRRTGHRLRTRLVLAAVAHHRLLTAEGRRRPRRFGWRDRTEQASALASPHGGARATLACSTWPPLFPGRGGYAAPDRSGLLRGETDGFKVALGLERDFLRAEQPRRDALPRPRCATATRATSGPPRPARAQVRINLLPRPDDQGERPRPAPSRTLVRVVVTLSRPIDPRACFLATATRCSSAWAAAVLPPALRRRLPGRVEVRRTAVALTGFGRTPAELNALIDLSLEVARRAQAAPGEAERLLLEVARSDSWPSARAAAALELAGLAPRSLAASQAREALLADADPEARFQVAVRAGEAGFPALERALLGGDARAPADLPRRAAIHVAEAFPVERAIAVFRRALAGDRLADHALAVAVLYLGARAPEALHAEIAPPPPGVARDREPRGLAAERRARFEHPAVEGVILRLFGSAGPRKDLIAAVLEHVGTLAALPILQASLDAPRAGDPPAAGLQRAMAAIAERHRPADRGRLSLAPLAEHEGALSVSRP